MVALVLPLQRRARHLGLSVTLAVRPLNAGWRYHVLCIADIGFVTVVVRRWRSGGVREFARGVVRLHILHHAVQQPIHGAWMTVELARHGYQISPGTLYPTLHRLQAEGLLVSERTVVQGRTRRVYRATEAGRAALAADRVALAELAREVLPGEGGD